MTVISDNSKGRSGPLGTLGGAWRLLIISVVLIMILPLGASAFMFRNDTAHTGVYNNGGTPNNVSLWNYSFGGFQYRNASNFSYIMDNSTYASPAVVNGVVYEGSLGGNFTALNATTGAALWTFTVSPAVGADDIHASAAVDVGLGVVYFTSYDHNLYARNIADGSSHWASPADIGAAGHSSPAVVGGFVYVGSDNGNISKFNADTGALIWSNRTNTTPMVGNYDKMHSSPAVVGNVVYVGSEDWKLYAMDATTGAVLWNRTTGGPILSSPAVVNNVVYVGSNDGYVYALNTTAGGSNYWPPFFTDGGVQTSPAVANGVVYVGSIDGGLYAINAITGAGVSNWPYNTGRAIYSSPAVANGRVYVGNNDGKVYCIDVNGTKIWDYTTVGDATNNWIFSSPAVVNGVVYIGGGEGNTRLYAIGNLTAAVQAPIASFTANTTSGTAPLAVLFTNTSTNTPTAWNWSFRNITPGNNTQVWFSTVQNPTHTFGVGNYSIVLNASNSGGYNLSTQVTFINVTAVPAPVTNATATTGVYRPGAGFYLKMDNTSTWNPSTDLSLTWDNAAGDLPVAGDWNMDGRAETGVYRPGAGFYLKMDNTSTWNPSTDLSLTWDNANGDLPIAGKFV